MSKLLARDIGALLCTAMGIDANSVRSVSFDWDVQSPALVTVEYYINAGTSEAITKVFEAAEWREVLDAKAG